MGGTIAGDPSLPTLSQLKAWQTEHFAELADWCEAEAKRWEDSFAGVHQLVKNSDWDGDGKDAAVSQTERDVYTARGAGQCLRAAAPLLRMTGENERFAKVAALRGVAEAEEAGFNLGDDLSLHDPTDYSSWEQSKARLDQARSLAQDIHREARSLLRIDQDIAERLPPITAALRDLKFDDDGHDGHVQLVDNKFKHAPAGAGDVSSGDLDGIDHANRRLLDDMFREYSHLPDGQVKTDRLADIAGIRQALQTPDSHLIYLAKPDDPSQMIPAATAIGNPFTADHTSVTVPGVGSTTRQSIAGMTQEARGLQLEAQNIEQQIGTHDTVSTIAWTGYQPPPVITSWDTASDGLAKAGAPKLESFLSDLNAGSHNPGHTTALFGHSYGSLLSGIALKDGASSMVDNVVLYGSPGFEASSPAQLGMSDGHFFVMSTPDDPIRSIGEFAPLHGWGSDPNQIIFGDSDRYRFTHLETQAGMAHLGDTDIYKTGASGHSEYGQDPLQRMTGYNLAAILLNRPDLTVKEGVPQQ